MKFVRLLIGFAAIAVLPVFVLAQTPDPPTPPPKKIKGAIKPTPGETPTPSAPPGGRPPPIKISPSGLSTARPGGRALPPIKLPNPNNAKFDAALAEPFAPQVFQWQAGAPPNVLVPAATHICLLTGISGDFAGSGERIALYVDNGAPGGPRWTLNGTSGQPQLRATATCVAKAKFVHSSSSARRAAA